MKIKKVDYDIKFVSKYYHFRTKFFKIALNSVLIDDT
jgi:hypothetical protein